MQFKKAKRMPNFKTLKTSASDSVLFCSNIEFVDILTLLILNNMNNYLSAKFGKSLQYIEKNSLFYNIDN